VIPSSLYVGPCKKSHDPSESCSIAVQRQEPHTFKQMHHQCGAMKTFVLSKFPGKYPLFQTNPPVDGFMNGIITSYDSISDLNVFRNRFQEFMKLSHLHLYEMEKVVQTVIYTDFYRGNQMEEKGGN